jgi:hypothetical protein
MKRQDIAPVEAVEVAAARSSRAMPRPARKKIVPGKIDFVAVDNDFVLLASD